MGGVFDGHRQLLSTVDTRQLATDVYAVLTWVVRGGFAHLAEKLPPALRRLCTD